MTVGDAAHSVLATKVRRPQSVDKPCQRVVEEAAPYTQTF